MDPANRTNRTPPGARTREWPPWARVFLTRLADSGSVVKAARAAKIGRSTAYDLRDDDELFAAAWKVARYQSADVLESEAWRRAVTGTLKPVYQGGQLVGKIREYSDTLLIFLLKHADPERFNPPKDVRVGGAEGAPPIPVRAVEDLDGLDADSLADVIDHLRG